MSRRIKTLLVMMVVIVVLGIGALTLRPTKGDGVGKFSMLNIGQGDSFLIQAPDGAQLLIDGGRDATVLGELARVMPAGDHSIDVMIATHPDADHVGGLPLVLQRYKVGLFLTSQVNGDTLVYKDLMHELDTHHVPAYYVRRGMTIALDPNASFKIIFPDRITTNWETNHASVVGRLDIGKSSALFTGDSPISIEHYLATAFPKDIDVDILKLGHHGSKTSSSEEYLKATSPALALISAGVNNHYGHPHQEVLDHLKAAGIPWISTQDKGTVTFVADGTKWNIEK